MELITATEARGYLAIDENTNMTDEDVQAMTDLSNATVIEATRKRYSFPFLVNYTGSDAEKLLKGLAFELVSIKVAYQSYKSIRDIDDEGSTNIMKREEALNKKLARLSGNTTPIIDLYGVDNTELPLKTDSDGEVSGIDSDFGEDAGHPTFSKVY